MQYISFHRARRRRKAVDSGEHSRTALARGLCEGLAQFRRRVVSGVGAEGAAATGRQPGPCRHRDRGGGRPLDAYVTLFCRLQELGDARVEPVVRTEVTLWRDGVAPSPGREATTRSAASVPFRRVAVAWAASASALQAGAHGTPAWTQRAARRTTPVFWSCPAFACRRSPALGLALSRLADDWQAGVRPALAYTYVDVGKTGSCYAAAGRCEKTTVRGRSAKPLCAGEALREPTRREPAPPEIADWAEYGHPSRRTAADPGAGGKSGRAGLRARNAPNGRRRIGFCRTNG